MISRMGSTSRTPLVFIGVLSFLTYMDSFEFKVFMQNFGIAFLVSIGSYVVTWFITNMCFGSHGGYHGYKFHL